MNTYRTTALIVGVIYLAGFVVGIAGTGISQSILGAPDRLSALAANSTILAIAAILWMMAVVGDAAHGVLMFPVLKQHSERLAIGYLGFRIIDAVFIAVSVLFLLIQLPLGSEYLKAGGSSTLYLQTLSTLSIQANLYAYYIGMMTLGISGLLLNYVFLKSKMVPRIVAIWGLVGYAIILVGMVSAVMGSGLADLSSLPGGLWEMFIGVWLIAKGFQSTTIASQPTRISNPRESIESQPVSVNS